MKPTFPVTTNVQIVPRNYFDLFSSGEIKFAKIRTLVVPSQIARLATIFALLTNSADATAVAIFVSGTAIVIGTDGVEMATEGGTKSFWPICKIRQEETRFYTAAGTYGVPKIKFDVWALALDAIRRASNIEGVYAIIEPAILRRLPAVVKISKTDDQETYERWLKGTSIVQLSFAGFEESTPIVATIEFRINAKGEIVKPIKTTVRGIPGKTRPIFLGTHFRMDAATSAGAWGPEFSRDHISFVDGLIQLEIDAAKKEQKADVGPPISIVTITKTGGQWDVYHTGVCKQQTPTEPPIPKSKTPPKR
jgi:hypothetical protein